MTLQYMITELSRHPDIQERLYDEIVKVIRPGEKLDKENVYKISYLKLVLKETLR
jgi:cytochrome P450 family 89 subfamily A